MNNSDRPRSTWSHVSEIPAVCLDRRNLIQCVAAAALVGSILFFINQADVVLSGRATVSTWVKIGLSYLVPLVVSN